MADPVDRLHQISEPPLAKECFDTWLAMDDALAFLRDNSQQDEFVVYAANQSTFIRAILVPASLLNPPDVDDLMSWNCDASSSWSIDVRFSDPRSVWISPPLNHTGSKTLAQGEQLVFAHHFEGRTGKKSHYEILQKFTHVFDLHFMEERHAYCRLDARGDLEDVIRVVERPGKGGEFGADVVTFNRSILDEYLFLTNSVSVRTFDFTRYQRDFGGWDAYRARLQGDGEMFYRSHVEPGYASYSRGFQLVRSTATREAIIRRFDHTVPQDRQYASFIAHDLKNNAVREISCAPGHTANYFTECDLPFEMSAAFFRPEGPLVDASFRKASQPTALSSHILCRRLGE